MPDLGGSNAIFIAIFIGAMIVFGAIVLAWTSGGSDAIAKRINKVAGQTKLAANLPKVVSVRRRNAGLPEGGGRRLLSRMIPARNKIAARLIKAGKTTTPEAYALICVIVALVAALMLIALLKMPAAFALPLGIISGVILPWLILSRMAAKRSRKFLQEFPDAIDLLVRSVRVGLPVAEAISIGGRDLPEPIGSEFAHMSNLIRLGRTFEEAMWEVADRIEIAEFNFFATSLAVQRETGGNIAETLSNLGTLIRARHQMKKKVKAISSEARASAWIVGSLPFIMFALLLMINYDYITAMFNDIRGNVLLGLGLGWQLIGVAIMAKVARFEI